MRKLKVASKMDTKLIFLAINWNRVDIARSLLHNAKSHRATSHKLLISRALQRAVSRDGVVESTHRREVPHNRGEATPFHS